MSNSLTEDYLRWLEPQIRDENDGLSNPNREFWGLLTLMYEKEFVWLESIPTDDNRMMDGLDLRVEFCREQRLMRDPTVRRFLDHDANGPEPPVSFLEVLIGLSRRLAFNAGGSAPGWAWILLANLGLHRMADPLSRRSANRANDIIDRCMWRNYSSNGRGGFFPLNNPQHDQTQVEIWYQMMAYIIEMPHEH
jgi:hypothetical protein